MEEVINSSKELLSLIEQARLQIKATQSEAELKGLKNQQQQPDFWDDNIKAQNIQKKISKLESRLIPWQELQKNVSEVQELAQMGDESVKEQLKQQLKQASESYQKLAKELRFNGPYDEYNAIINIYSGAGGTDAQDWAQMIQRMYLRWAEKQGIKANVVSESAGDEAGIKSATIELSGPLVYGKLKNEHGVHRLVRLSPFNSGSTRETSFAKVDVLPEVDQPEELKIEDKDLKIDVYRAGGHGGQSVNTTDSAVRITHLPTGITVAIQNERSQLQNKDTALTILRSRLVQLQLEQHKETIADLKGPNEQAAWGNQIRNYVLHPYQMVKDTRTKAETSDVQAVLDGNLDIFIA